MNPRLRIALTALGIAALCGSKAPLQAPASRTAVAAPRPIASPQSNPALALERLPLAFEPSAHGGDAFLTHVGSGAARASRSGLVIWPRAGEPAIDIDFAGATVGGPLEPSQRLPGYVNYLIGDDRSKWRTHVPTYARVRATDVYLGIDVEYYGTGHRLEYDFLVRPHANPSAIRLRVQGGRAEKTASGALAIEGIDGRVLQRRPTAFQSIGGVRTRVASDYVRRDDGTFGIELGPYDAREALVIDPLVETFTFQGGRDRHWQRRRRRPEWRRLRRRHVDVDQPSDDQRVLPAAHHARSDQHRRHYLQADARSDGDRVRDLLRRGWRRLARPYRRGRVGHLFRRVVAGCSGGVTRLYGGG